MAIYQITGDGMQALQECTFADQGIRERVDLQRMIKSQVSIVSPDTLVIAEEFGEWEGSRRRIDLLGLDRDANIVVIELKRTEDGGHMELQAIRYAAMVSTLTFDKVVGIYGRHLKQQGSEDDPQEGLLEFLGWDTPDEDEFAQEVRIVLASAEFSKELTTAVMWLNDHGLDIRCVRLKPYMDGDRTLLDVQTVIPLPEAESYQVQIREKQQRERESRRLSRDFTRYDITVDGTLYENLPKRWAMYHVVRHLIGRGATPQEINETISWRKTLFQEFDGELSSDELIERLMERDLGGKVPNYRRYFSQDDEIFRVNGKTYALSNQWGGRTIEAIELLARAFPQVAISIRARA
jgi:hypothetical protein